MRGFKLDENGDILIKNNEIQMIEGNELLQQTAQSVVGTNKGEWVLNREEGIMFSNILGKGNTDEMIRNEIQQGLKQVDDSFIVTSYEKEVDTVTRKAVIHTKATNAIGEEIASTNIYR